MIFCLNIEILFNNNNLISDGDFDNIINNNHNNNKNNNINNK